MGDVIGRVGTTGFSTGYHLHYAISTSSRYWETGFVNPEPKAQPYIYKLNVKPDAPSSVNLNTNSLGKGDTLVASWNKVSTASKYTVNLVCTTDSSKNAKKTVSGTSASFTLNNEGTYYVSVSATNASGTSSAKKSSNATVYKNNGSIDAKVENE